MSGKLWWQTLITAIRLLNQNGYEFFYIINFDLGPRFSKWYRGQSPKMHRACRLAVLNVLGIDNATILKLHYDHYLTKKSTEIEWTDFANEFVRVRKGMLYYI